MDGFTITISFKRKRNSNVLTALIFSKESSALMLQRFNIIKIYMEFFFCFFVYLVCWYLLRYLRLLVCFFLLNLSMIYGLGQFNSDFIILFLTSFEQQIIYSLCIRDIWQVFIQNLFVIFHGTNSFFSL